MNIFKISRPRFWLYLAGPYLLGYFYGLYSLGVSWQFIYTFLYFLVPANIYLYGINDYFDRDTDFFNEKKTSKEHRLLFKEKKQLIIWLIISVLLLIPIFVWSSLTGSLILLVWLVLSTMYSAPPRFKAIPFLDFLSNILYVLPGFYAYFELTKQFPSLLVIIASFAWVWAMHIYSAVPDVEADKKAKLKTTALVLGQKMSLFLCVILWSVFSVIISIKASPLGALTIVYPILALYTLKNINRINKVYWYFPYVTAFIGFLGFVHASLFFIL
ncbi:prenyltransferase [Candidatus Woesearchaeota archaeon]|nr:prenyltransferase [Candidatus Woesearchaeota archaeon]